MAGLFRGKLGGVQFGAQPTRQGLAPLSPLRRLLDALYLELWGLATRAKRLRHCPRCAHFFIRGREDQIFCTGRCARLWHVKRWKGSMLAQYQQILKSQLLPVFGELRVSAITESRIRQLITGPHDTGLSARPSNLTLRVLKMILRPALRCRYFRDDPIETIRSLREPRAEVDPLDPEEVTAFLTACPVWWRPYFTVAFWTGARPNELAALRWGDVDGAQGIVRIRAGRDRGKEGPPKTASRVRDIDLLPPVGRPSPDRITSSRGRKRACST